MQLASFSLGEIVIIQSLDEIQRKSGDEIYRHVSKIIEEKKSSLQVRIINCGSAIEFQHIIENLTNELKGGGRIPLLHIECDGDEKEGLNFANNSDLSWEQVAVLLSHLNSACETNLLAIFSACFGGYFVSQIKPNQAMPCYGAIGPSSRIHPDEIEKTLKDFYSALLSSMDAGLAVQSLTQTRLSSGRWFCQTAEEWFEGVLIRYVQEHCTRDAITTRAREMYRKLCEERKKNSAVKWLSIGQLKRKILSGIKNSTLDDMFGKFFRLREFPANRERYSFAYDRIKRRMNSILSGKDYRL